MLSQCLVCGSEAADRPMFRIYRVPGGRPAWDFGTAVSDETVFLCKTVDCLSRAKTGQVLERALGAPVPAPLFLSMAKALAPEHASAEALLGFAVRSRKAVLGATAVLEAATRKKLRLIILSKNAGPSTRSRIGRMAQRYGLPVRVHGGSVSLEEACRKPNCVCVGIVDPRFAARLMRMLDGRTA